MAEVGWQITCVVLCIGLFWAVLSHAATSAITACLLPLATEEGKP